MSKCGVCATKISASKLKLDCVDCKNEFHASCLKMSKADVDCITADGLVWRCLPCSSTRRKSMRFESDAAEGTLTLDDLMKAVIEIRDLQKKSEKDTNVAYETLNEKIDGNTKVLNEQNAKMDEYLKTIETLMKENADLKKKIVSLESRIEDMEQYSRNNCVEIHGIPQEPTEDVVNVVKEVGKALDMKITDEMIDACHRLKKRPGAGNQQTPGIVVKFVRRIDKEELMRKRRIKHNFSTRHMNLAMDLPVFINESLSPARRRLFVLAREVKRSKNFKYLWVRGGKVFLRREDGAPVVHVTCQADLSKLT